MIPTSTKKSKAEEKHSAVEMRLRNKGVLKALKTCRSFLVLNDKLDCYGTEVGF